MTRVPERWDVGQWDTAHWDGELGLDAAVGAIVLTGNDAGLLRNATYYLDGCDRRDRAHWQRRRLSDGAPSGADGYAGRDRAHWQRRWLGDHTQSGADRFGRRRRLGGQRAGLAITRNPVLTATPGAVVLTGNDAVLSTTAAVNWVLPAAAGRDCLDGQRCRADRHAGRGDRSGADGGAGCDRGDGRLGWLAIDPSAVCHAAAG